MSQHTIACAQCPFRKTSLQGYLGANNLDDFASLASTETRMPCHMAVDYRKKSWEEDQQESPQCAGRAAMWRNSSKLPRDKDLLVVEKDPAVFTNIQEFRNYHGKYDRKTDQGTD